MLINVDPILSPDILKTLREMGHGDRLVISDINYPAHSNHNRVHRLDGLDMTTVMRAVLSVFPLVLTVRISVVLDLLSIFASDMVSNIDVFSSRDRNGRFANT